MPTYQEAATTVQNALPQDGLFAGLTWRISPAPFQIESKLAREIESLGRVLVQFYRAINLLYRKSAEGKQPAWIAELLDTGKPRHLIELQRSASFKNDIPRVIRPDILLDDGGFHITELDSVPGGIGLTAWLNQTYSKVGQVSRPLQTSDNESSDVKLIGTADSMLKGFESIFNDAQHVHLVVSEEAATYRPEMNWIASQLGSRFSVRDSQYSDFKEGDAIYRFFELFDLENVSSSQRILELASAKRVHLTPPPKPIFEEKLLFALLWNRNLQEFWRQELGEAFLKRLKEHIPYTWVIDPTPLPPHAAIPELNLTNWQQLKTMSQKERDLILKVSGFSPQAWGARGVHLGSDMPHEDWSKAVDEAINSFTASPHILQRYHKPRLVESQWFDFEKNEIVPMKGRVRLCPYYFVAGEGDAARPQLGSILATINPADKKIIHGMSDAILAPCAI